MDRILRLDPFHMTAERSPHIPRMSTRIRVLPLPIIAFTLVAQSTIPTAAAQEGVSCGPYRGPASADVVWVGPAADCASATQTIRRFLDGPVVQGGGGAENFDGWTCSYFRGPKADSLGYAASCSRADVTVLAK